MNNNTRLKSFNYWAFKLLTTVYGPNLSLFAELTLAAQVEGL